VAHAVKSPEEAEFVVDAELKIHPAVEQQDGRDSANRRRWAQQVELGRESSIWRDRKIAI